MTQKRLTLCAVLTVLTVTTLSVQQSLGEVRIAQAKVANGQSLSEGLRETVSIEPLAEIRFHRPPSPGALPQSKADDLFLRLPKSEQSLFQDRGLSATSCDWKAARFCHPPLYFEEASLERCGVTAFPTLQPFVSATRFGFNVMALPFRLLEMSRCPSLCEPAQGEPTPSQPAR